MPITREVLDELLKDYKTPEDLLGENGVLKGLTKALIERAMEAELTHELGYGKHEVAGYNSGNSRNGKTSKTVTGKQGTMRIEVPRDRLGEFEPRIIPKHQRRFDGFDDKIISLYARGMTVREIQGHLEEIYAVAEAVAADLTALPADVLARFEAKYDRLSAQGLALSENALPFVAGSRGRPKQSKSKNLLDRLTTHQAFVLTFLHDFRVPFDNNRAERDLRMMKLKQKVSGGFRTSDGAAAFACLRGFISTLKKQGRNVFAALKSVFAGCPVNPLPTG